MVGLARITELQKLPFLSLVNGPRRREMEGVVLGAVRGKSGLKLSELHK